MSLVRWGIMGGMTNPDIKDTVPFTVPPSAEEPPRPVGKKRSPWKSLTLLGILALILIGATSAYAGYSSGIAQRKEAESSLASVRAAEQFDLAVQDIAGGEYQHARQRLEYVAQLDPNYPGLTEKLADVLARINTTATPTLAPTPTVAATADTRGVDGMFSQAQEMLNNGDWPGAIETLLKLRQTDVNYQAVKMDGMLFMALRNRGLDKIAKQADLEGGMYDLSQAAQFGPLDTEAQGYITWVSLYITGASFWELDWQKAVEYFSQVGPALPGLRDRSGWTAQERYRLALKGYGETLATAGDFCGAAEQFQLSLSIGADPEVETLLNEVYTVCQGASAETQPSEEAPVITTEAPPLVEPTPPVIEPTQPTVEPTPPEATPYP